MSLSRRMGLILLCFPVASCGPQLWAKPGGTAAEFEGAKAGCNSQSYSMFPPMYQQVMVTTGYVQPQQTSCYGGGYSVNCYSTGGNYVPPTYVPVDQNQGARNGAARSCLMTAGWQPVKDKEEAVLVTNSASAFPASQQRSAESYHDWNTARAECRVEASAKSAADGNLFANAFYVCMKARGL